METASHHCWPAGTSTFISSHSMSPSSHSSFLWSRSLSAPGCASFCMVVLSMSPIYGLLLGSLLLLVPQSNSASSPHRKHTSIYPSGLQPEEARPELTCCHHIFPLFYPLLLPITLRLEGTGFPLPLPFYLWPSCVTRHNPAYLSLIQWGKRMVTRHYREEKFKYIGLIFWKYYPCHIYILSLFVEHMVIGLLMNNRVVMEIKMR